MTNQFFMILALILFGPIQWTSGENIPCTVSSSSILCINAEGRFLKDIPSENIADMTFLRSELKYISKRDFSKFTSVSDIIIDECNVPQTILNYTLSLEGLKALKIMNSNITENDFPGLRKDSTLVDLSLQGNQFTLIKKGVFDNVSGLQEIDLSHNEISAIEAGAFEGLPALRRLDLSHNMLSDDFDPASLSLPAGCDFHSLVATCTRTRSDDGRRSERNAHTHDLQPHSQEENQQQEQKQNEKQEEEGKDEVQENEVDKEGQVEKQPRERKDEGQEERQQHKKEDQEQKDEVVEDQEKEQREKERKQYKGSGRGQDSGREEDGGRGNVRIGAGRFADEGVVAWLLGGGSDTDANEIKITVLIVRIPVVFGLVLLLLLVVILIVIIVLFCKCGLRQVFTGSSPQLQITGDGGNSDGGGSGSTGGSRDGGETGLDSPGQQNQKVPLLPKSQNDVDVEAGGTVAKGLWKWRYVTSLRRRKKLGAISSSKWINKNNNSNEQGYRMEQTLTDMERRLMGRIIDLEKMIMATKGGGGGEEGTVGPKGDREESVPLQTQLQGLQRRSFGLGELAARPRAWEGAGRRGPVNSARGQNSRRAETPSEQSGACSRPPPRAPVAGTAVAPAAAPRSGAAGTTSEPAASRLRQSRSRSRRRSRSRSRRSSRHSSSAGRVAAESAERGPRTRAMASNMQQQEARANISDVLRHLKEQSFADREQRFLSSVVDKLEAIKGGATSVKDRDSDDGKGGIGRRKGKRGEKLPLQTQLPKLQNNSFSELDLILEKRRHEEERNIQERKVDSKLPRIDTVKKLQTVAPQVDDDYNVHDNESVVSNASGMSTKSSENTSGIGSISDISNISDISSVSRTAGGEGRLRHLGVDLEEQLLSALKSFEKIEKFHDSMMTAFKTLDNRVTSVMKQVVTPVDSDSDNRDSVDNLNWAGASSGIGRVT